MNLICAGRKASVCSQGMKPTEIMDVLSHTPRSSMTSAVRPSRRIQPMVSSPKAGVPRIPRTREMIWVYLIP